MVGSRFDAVKLFFGVRRAVRGGCLTAIPGLKRVRFALDRKSLLLERGVRQVVLEERILRVVGVAARRIDRRVLGFGAEETEHEWHCTEVRSVKKQLFFIS